MAACDSSKAVFAPGWPRSFFAPKLTAEAFGEAFPPPARLQRDNQSRAGTDQCSSMHLPLHNETAFMMLSHPSLCGVAGT